MSDATNPEATQGRAPKARKPTHAELVAKRAEIQAVRERCEADHARRAKSEAARSKMANVLRLTGQEADEDMLPPLFVPDPDAAAELHRLIYEAAEMEKALGL